MNDLMDFIQQVKRSNDIVDVVGSYLELHQRGTNYFARCPFHGEKTPSFTVSRNRQIYKCFGCGESGDVIKFVQMHESCSFMEAIEILAKRAGLKMPETAANRQDKQFEERKKKKDVYLAICKDTGIFYYKCFYSPSGQVAREYMQKRGYNAETLKKFGIGYSPDRFSLVKYLERKGYSHDDCLKAGVLQTMRDGTLFDALEGRLIVPIFNVNGKVIAFGGRGLDERTISYGKYKNTSDTPLFTKRDNLFAINIVKEEKQKAPIPNVVMVEGYMDVIAMHQAGFRRAVASMGTSLTENQAKLLSRFTDTVYICYDGDSAGQKATVRGLDILDAAGLEVQVMSVPENLDPDEYIKKYGSEAFEKLIEKAMPLPDYKLTLLERSFPIESVDTATRNRNIPKFVKGAMVMLKQLDDVRQNRYITEVSKRTGYSAEFLRRKLEEDVDASAIESTEKTTTTPELKAKYFVAASMLTNQEYAYLSEKPYCETAFLSNVFDYIFNCKQRGEQPRMDMIYTVCPDALEEEYAEITDLEFTSERRKNDEKYFQACKKLLEVEKLKQQQEALQRQYAKEPDNKELLIKLAELSGKINRLNKGD